MNRGWVRVAASAIGIGFIAAAWLGLGPRSLGGSVDYVAVARGSSMEPTFHVGDLALTRPRPVASYAVGDVVATRTDYGRIVLHRIASIGGERLVTKGDNNDEVDQYQPLRSDVMGSLWLRIPSGGRLLGLLRPPIVLLPLGIVLAAWLLISSGKPARARRGNGRRERAPRSASPAPLRSGAPPTISETVFGAAAVVLIACGLIAMAAFSRPTRAAAERSVAHQGAFSYAGSVAGATGPEARIETGDPAFLRLTRRLRVNFAYGFEVDASHSVAGDWRLVAELSSPNGWRRVVPLTPVSPYQGDRFEASGILDLRALRNVVLATEDRSGVVNPTYALAVRADVHARGNIEGRSINEAFSPEMRFTLDALQAQLQVADHKAGESVAVHEENSVSVPGAALNHITVVKIPLPVDLARGIGVVGVAGAILTMAAAGLLIARSKREDEPTRIGKRWGRALTAIEAPIVTGSFTAAASFEDLVRLAERYDRQIMYHVDGDRHAYMVEEGSRVFQYVAQAERAPERVEKTRDLAFLQPLLDRRHA
ncbi:MAG: signal peptidase I [Actinomycetota bacterium]